MAASLLLGAGGHAKVLAETAMATGRLSRIAFLGDLCTSLGLLAAVLGCTLLGPFAATSEPQLAQQRASALVGIGDGTARLQWLQRVTAAGYEFLVLIHPTGCSVDHDAQLGDGIHICLGAHLAGEVRVGDRSWIGIDAPVIQQIYIGSDVIGAAVVRDLPDGFTAVEVLASMLPTA